jgi:hypothetical protein
LENYKRLKIKTNDVNEKSEKLIEKMQNEKNSIKDAE